MSAKIKKQLINFVTRYYTYAASAVAIAVLSLCCALTVNAAPGNLSPPFDEGTTWNVCQGYANAGGTHTGTSRLSLDLTGSGCDNSASGRLIRSPQNGTASWYSQASGSLCVSTTSGVSVMLTHIDASVSAGTSVTLGQVVGSIAAPGYRQNNGVAHLHIQAWSTPNCSNSNDQIPLSSQGNARICGMPDMVTPGPNTFNTGEWGGTTFTATACKSEIPASSAAVYRFYSPSVKRHLYTPDQGEANYLIARMRGTWNLEGISFYAPSTTNCPADSSVYRFYSPSLKTHLYTMDESEKAYISNTFPSSVWAYEGVSFCASKTQMSQNQLPTYRFYSPQLKTHLYTNDENEKNTIIQTFSPEIWSFEGISYFAYPK